LKKTLTRHFQKWTDATGRPHATYKREDVLVGVIHVDSKSVAFVESLLIWSFWPKDNLDRPDNRPVVTPGEEEIPF
jgi:hypothetical protein